MSYNLQACRRASIVASTFTTDFTVTLRLFPHCTCHRVFTCSGSLSLLEFGSIMFPRANQNQVSEILAFVTYDGTCHSNVFE